MKQFKDKVAIITGGASGIGLGIGRALAAEGAHLVVADIDEENATKAAEDLRGRGARSVAIRADVREIASVDAIFDAAKSEFGGTVTETPASSGLSSRTPAANDTSVSVVSLTACSVPCRTSGRNISPVPPAGVSILPATPVKVLPTNG